MKLNRARRHTINRPASSLTFRLGLEQLEARLALAAFTVNSVLEALTQPGCEDAEAHEGFGEGHEGFMDVVTVFPSYPKSTEVT